MFPLFQRLPTELRLQIWREALPERIENPLYFYKNGCWGLRRPTEADADYDPNPEYNLNLEFNHNRLDPLQVEVPLFLVNREAHSFALEWISGQRQGLKPRFNKEKQLLVLNRPFDPERDTVYVSEEKWKEFHREPFDRLFETEQQVGSPAPAFTRLAVPDQVLLKDPDTLAELFNHYYGLDEIFVIFSVQSDGSWYDIKNIQPQERWELDTLDVQWPSFSWSLDSASFQWKDDDKNISDYPVYNILQHASLEWSEKLLEIGKKRFEIHPAFAVRKQ